MGRKRRDQRDRTRKQRAKKRSRLGLGCESDDDDEGVVSVAVGPRASDGERGHDLAAAASCEPPVRGEKERGDDRPGAGDEPTASGPDAGKEAVGERESPAGGQKPSRIERMRQKKRLQKARRREKKAAREGGVTAATRGE